MAELVNAPEDGNAAEVERPEESIPEQFRGKSPEQLIDMYRNLEKKLGEQASELGSLRSLAEQQVAAVSSTESEDVDFFDNPEKAIERIIERKLAPFNDSLQSQAEAAMKERLDSSYPGWKETAQSSEFQDWVAKSKVRTRLYVAADKADWDAADELFSTWSALQESSTKTESAKTKAVERDRKLRAATTEKGSAGVDPRKILSRADLRTLKQTNPSRYNELLPDIRKAYAEGRVR